MRSDEPFLLDLPGRAGQEISRKFERRPCPRKPVRPLAGWRRPLQSATDAFSLRNAPRSAAPRGQRDAQDPRDMQYSQSRQNPQDPTMMRRGMRFGSLEQFEKGGVEVLCDDPRNYAFSNIFEVASTSAPYEKAARQITRHKDAARDSSTRATLAQDYQRGGFGNLRATLVQDDPKKEHSAGHSERSLGHPSLNLWVILPSR
jgi:hypothetical protein